MRMTFDRQTTGRVIKAHKGIRITVFAFDIDVRAGELRGVDFFFNLLRGRDLKRRGAEPI